MIVTMTQHQSSESKIAVTNTARGGHKVLSAFFYPKLKGILATSNFMILNVHAEKAERV